MAALDRRISILDEFVGQSWNTWTDKPDVFAPEAPAQGELATWMSKCFGVRDWLIVVAGATGSSGDECSKNVKKRMETMTLRKEDMCIYGHCPAHDDFYLVVCSHCGQVVKPQAFEKHCERRHGPLSKLCGFQSSLSSSRSSPPSQRTQQSGSRPLSQHGQEGKQQGAEPHRVPPPHSPIHKPPKTLKDGASMLQMAKISHSSPPSPPYLSALLPKDPPWNRGSTPPKMPTPPPEKPSQKGTEAHRPPHGPRTYSRTYKKVPKKECDLDKHCGVLDLERKKLCTRLLTCNIHSIHQRRQVAGRSKSFDQLVLELKMSSKARERPPQTRDAPENASPGPQASASVEPALQICRRQGASVSLRSKTPPVSVAEQVEECSRPCDEGNAVSAQRPPPHPASLSSDESDGENQEEAADLPSSTCHPKPLGLCTFGARVLGCSVLAFDRRLFRLRSALTAMLEQHLNAHLWKKIPQVSELRSPSSFISSHDAIHSLPNKVPAPSASFFRTSSSSSSYVPRRPTGDAGTSGQSVSKTSFLTSPSKTLTKAPIPNPVPISGKPPKFSHPQERPTCRKRRRGDEPGTPDPNKNFQRAGESHRTLNGILSPLSAKPRPHSHLPENQGLVKRSPVHVSTRSTPPLPASHFLPESSSDGGRISAHERKGTSKKRKTAIASSPSEPPPPPPHPSVPHPKTNSLASSQHHPNAALFWRRDGNKAGTASFSTEKKLDAPKPKLHH